jgi:uncharacterized membrane protein YdjX (TVP38/TMEM64 family)
MTVRRAATLLGSACATLLAAALTWFYGPHGVELVKLGAYTVVSNIYISVLPHEPVLIFYGKAMGPFWAMVGATVGAFVSGIIDHETLTRVLNIQKVRGLYENRRIYQVSARWYAKRPFLTIVVAALTPIPFYPVKFLALSASYPLPRYLLALIVGRAPKFYLYGWLGEALDIPNWVIVGAFVALVAPGVVIKLWQSVGSRRAAADARPRDD